MFMDHPSKGANTWFVHPKRKIAFDDEQVNRIIYSLVDNPARTTITLDPIQGRLANDTIHI